MTLKCDVRQRGDVTILDLSGLLCLASPIRPGPRAV
jgi:hypothetical protein